MAQCKKMTEDLIDKDLEDLGFSRIIKRISGLMQFSDFNALSGLSRLKQFFLASMTLADVHLSHFAALNLS